MYDFSKLDVSELRAISGDLGLKQNKSATRLELAAKVADYFQAKDVVSIMASLDRPKLQKVSRKLSVSPRTGTKREIAQRVVDAVQAGTITFRDESKPKSPKNSDLKTMEKDQKPDPTPAPAPANSTDPNPKKNWTWIFWVVAALVAIWLIGAAIDRAGRNPAVAATTATTTPTTVAVAPPATVEPAKTEVPSEPIVISPTEFDGTWTYDGRDGYHAFFVEVDKPGDVAKFAVYCEVECPTVVRLSPDDEIVSAYILSPKGTKTEVSFNLVTVPAGGTGDKDLDADLAARGANIVEGEILQQSKAAVTINAQAGSYLVFELKDKEELAVNVGLFIAIGE